LFSPPSAINRSKSNETTAEPAISAAAKPTAPPPNITADGAFTQHPSDVLIDLVADLLASMFIGAAGGDYRYARLAAVRTICVSMTEEVSAPTLLRLNLSAFSRMDLASRQPQDTERRKLSFN
jgi:hypothetical protein